MLTVLWKLSRFRLRKYYSKYDKLSIQIVFEYNNLTKHFNKKRIEN